MKKVGLREEEPNQSKNVAKERLQFILVQDRIKLTPRQMESLKEELLEVLNKYLEVDCDKIKMEVSRQEKMTALIANFPIKRV